MYQEHFNLSQEPFSIAPDPRFLFLSESHNEALAHLLYGFSHGGFVLISGEVGTGKTTLLRNLLDRTPADVDVAFILNPRLTVRELLETLCEELGVAKGSSNPESVKQYIDILNRHLLRTHQAGRSTVVVIDEAQNLTPAVLEQIRLLTNLETNEKKLLRIILLGQPELVDMLAKTELRQLSQRITARYNLSPLSKIDTHNYVTHRLARAGGHPDIFTKSALNALYRLSGGIPRLVNIIADRSMLGAFATGSYKVTPKLVRGAAKEVFGKPKVLDYKVAVTTLVAVVALVMLWAGWAKFTENQEPTSVAQSAAQTVNQTPTEVPAEVNRASQPDTTLIPAEPEPAANNRPVSQSSNQTSRSTQALETVDSSSSTTAITRPATNAFALQRSAFTAVFDLWGAQYSSASELIPCDFAPQVGLQCLRRTGGWSEVTALNMPIVLELWDSEPAPYYAALVGTEGGRHILSLGEETVSASPRDLRDAWFGAYVVLWQTPPSYNGSLRQGDRHPSVNWLRERFAQIRSDLSTAPNNTFDQELHDRVIEFQQAEGLVADGVVGPMTWIRINSYLANSSPRLVP